jgi:predicted ATPase
MSLSEKYSLAAYLNTADLMQGFVRVLRGDVETGVGQAEAALKTLKSVPTRQFHLPIRISIVGRAKAAAGDIEGALAIFESALDATSSTGEIWYEPETLRLKAEMLLALPKPRAAEAEKCLTAAIASAQKQDAKFWELRAATVLARLWVRQGRRAEARDLLAPVYGRFTEGFGNADVKDAAALLTELT